MKLLIAALAAAGLTGCVGYVPYYGGDAYAAAPAYGVPAYSAYPAYPAAYPYAYSAPYYYGPSISLGAVIAPGYHRGYHRGWRDGRYWH